jgi:phytanoyl-CoA hydroxylase
MISDQDREFYKENGYLGVENVLSGNELDELRRVTDEFVEKSRSISGSDTIFDLEPGHTSENPRLRRLKDPVHQHEVYKNALHHEKILHIVSQLIGPDLRCNGHKLNMKSAEFGSPVEWHQDWAFYPHTNDDILAVGVAIDEMTEANGCLLVIPESHKGRVLSHHQDGYFAGAVTEEDFGAENAVPVLVGAGGISIHHVRTLHGSTPNTSSKPRRLLLFQYCAADAWPLVQPVKSWDEFNATLVSGQPTLEPRVREVPVRIPLPPAPKSGSIYEIQTTLKKPMYSKKAV